jgi:hypothetical protein
MAFQIPCMTQPTPPPLVFFCGKGRRQAYKAGNLGVVSNVLFLKFSECFAKNSILYKEERNGKNELCPKWGKD